MRLAHTDNRRQSGFTLIELLVVVVIILILVGLTTAVVVKALGAGNRARTRTEISQLAVAVENFKQKFKVSYIPSRLKLCEIYSQYNLDPSDPNTLLDRDSVQYLQSLFPRMGDQWVSNGMDWNGNGTTNDGTVYLEGDQCLVFFLGGIPSASGPPYQCLGFATNPRNPADNTSISRIDPFFDFPSSRLDRFYANNFLSFRDPYGKQYAYFSSYKSRNGYNRYYTLLAPTKGLSDCQTLRVWAYVESTGTPIQYANSTSFQIVSAGPDLLFGQGSNPGDGTPTWTVQNAGAIGNAAHKRIFLPSELIVEPTVVGLDDLANFHDKPLGIGSN